MRIRGVFLKRLCLLVILLLLTYFNFGGLSCYFCVWPEQRTPRSNQQVSSVGEIEGRWTALSSPRPSSESPVGLTQAYSFTNRANKFQPDWCRNHTETACRTLGMNTDPSLVPAGAFEKVLVDDKHKLLFCHMAKVASTNLGKIFAVVTGLFNGTNPNRIRSSDVHLKYNSLQVHLNSLPIPDIAQKLRHYYKFTFVRDPLERLLSAFKNKFHKTPSNYFSHLSKKIVKVYRTNSTLTGGMTFEEFIRYVADPERKVPTNNHWQPFYELCRPCEVKYDFVGKLPTFNEDTRHVLEVNDLTNIVDFPKMPDTSHSLHKTDQLMEKYYSAIPKELLKQLFKIYFPDYAIFDLAVPSFIRAIVA